MEPSSKAFEEKFIVKVAENLKEFVLTEFFNRSPFFLSLLLSLSHSLSLSIYL
jgi:hypothetical protein